MSWTKTLFLSALSAATLASAAPAENFGRPAKPDEIKLWDIDVLPNGVGLPDGSGTVEHGKAVYEQNCAVCHGEGGQDGIKDRLVGGQGTLASDKPIKTIGSYWPYATTVFDYVRRAMPYQAPSSLSSDDYYAVVAYLLNLNGIVPANTRLDRQNLPKVVMPNRGGFIPDKEFTQFTNSR